MECFCLIKISSFPLFNLLRNPLINCLCNNHKFINNSRHFSNSLYKLWTSLANNNINPNNNINLNYSISLNNNINLNNSTPIPKINSKTIRNKAILNHNTTVNNNKFKIISNKFHWILNKMELMMMIIMMRTINQMKRKMMILMMKKKRLLLNMKCKKRKI